VQTQLPDCTEAQEVQNEEYCYNPEFGQQVCVFDGGVHCPERCGLCKRRFADPETSATVQVAVDVDQPIHEFQPVSFRLAFANAVAISSNSIQMTLSAGSTVVDMKIATVSGAPDAAAALNTKVNTVLSNPSSASSALNVPVLSVTSTVVSAPPSHPPYSPPLHPPSASPLPPPHLGAPPPPPPKEEGGGGVSVVAIIIASVTGALIVAVVLFVCFCMPKDDKRRQFDGKGRPQSTYPIIVYAETAWDKEAAAYKKI